jgi:hypothetical protein
VISGQAPTLYRFFVAAAFNDVRGAEKELSTAIRLGTHRDRLAMYHTYLRVGRYHRAVREVRLCWARPDTAPPDAVAKEDIAAVDQLPDRKDASHGAATLRYSNWPEMSVLAAPMVINGQGAQFLLDTDAGMSGIRETEAEVA